MKHLHHANITHIVLSHGHKIIFCHLHTSSGLRVGERSVTHNLAIYVTNRGAPAKTSAISSEVEKQQTYFLTRTQSLKAALSVDPDAKL